MQQVYSTPALLLTLWGLGRTGQSNLCCFLLDVRNLRIGTRVLFINGGVS